MRRDVARRGRRQTHFEVTVSLQEVTDFAIGDTQTMLEFGSHGQNDGAKGVTSGAASVGSLLGMSALDALPAAGTVASLDVELGDDGHDGRQIGLVLHDDLRINQFHIAVRTETAKDWDGAADLFRGRGGPQFGLVPWASAGFFLA